MSNEELMFQRRVTAQLPSRPLITAVEIAFRHRQLILISFLGVLLGAIALAVFWPQEFRAEAKLILRNNRVDPSLGGQSDSPQQLAPISEEQVNSEVELLKSSDVLRSVVTRTNLARPHSLFHRGESEAQCIERAVRQLGKKVHVEAAKRSNVITLSYISANPSQAAAVLNTLTAVYLERQSQIRDASGQYKFFDDQVERYRNQEAAIQKQLQQFSNVLPHVTRDSALSRLADLKTNLAQTRVAVNETQQRLRALKQQEALIPSRLVTQQKRADNAQLLQQLKGNLSTLELKRDELLAKYQPNYRPVQDLEQEIADLRTSIQKEETAPLRDDVTDENPTHVWIRSELEKAHADLAGLNARSAALTTAIGGTTQSTQELEKQSVVEADLLRDAKAAEDAYLLYLRKREDARIADALDRQGMFSVEVVQAASVPALPEYSRVGTLLVGLVLALFLSVAAAFCAEMFDGSYRTPQEVADYLQLPVLASIPHPSATVLIGSPPSTRRSFNKDALRSNSVPRKVWTGAAITLLAAGFLGFQYMHGSKPNKPLPIATANKTIGNVAGKNGEGMGLNNPTLINRGSVQGQENNVRQTASILLTHPSTTAAAMAGPVAKQLPTLATTQLVTSKQPSKTTGATSVPHRRVESKITRMVRPRYPNSALVSHVEGEVVLDVDVDGGGVIRDVHVVEGNALLCDAAIQAVRLWKFAPATFNGNPINSRNRVRFTFRLSDRG